MLYQGSQNETKRTKVAGPTTRSLEVRAFSRCRDFPTRFGVGFGITGRRMAAPHFGQSAVPKGTSTRQREHAGNRTTSFLLSRSSRLRLQAKRERLVPFQVRAKPDSRPRLLAVEGPLGNS
jgi:hypothetical protein